MAAITKGSAMCQNIDDFNRGCVPIMALLLAQPADGAEQIGPFGHQPAIAHLLPRFALSIV